MDRQMDPLAYEHALRVVFGTGTDRTKEHKGAGASSFSLGMSGDWTSAIGALKDGIDVLRPLGKKRLRDEKDKTRFDTFLDQASDGLADGTQDGAVLACSLLMAAMKLVL